MPSLPRTSRALAAAVAGVLATACGAPVRATESLRAATVATPIATLEVEAVAVTAVSSIEEGPVAQPALADSGPTILIERAHDPNRVASGLVATVGTTVQRTLDRAGFSTASRAEPAKSGEAEFLLTPTVHSLTVSSEGPRTTISCSVTLRISPWSAVDQTERWEPHTTALATGEASATTSNVRAQVELGVRDCLEGAVRAAAAREVIPFLRRLTLESKNISGSTSRAEL